MKSESRTRMQAAAQTVTLRPIHPGPNAARSRGPAAAPPGTYRYQEAVPTTTPNLPRKGVDVAAGTECPVLDGTVGPVAGVSPGAALRRPTGWRLTGATLTGRGADGDGAGSSRIGGLPTTGRVLAVRASLAGASTTSDALLPSGVRGWNGAPGVDSPDNDPALPTGSNEYPGRGEFDRAPGSGAISNGVNSDAGGTIGAGEPGAMRWVPTR